MKSSNTPPQGGVFFFPGWSAKASRRGTFTNMKLPVSSAVVGVSFRQGEVCQLSAGDKISVRHEPGNPYDSNAMAVLKYDSGQMLGYLPKALAPKLLELGESFLAHATDVRLGNVWGFDVLITEVTDEGAWSAQLPWSTQVGGYTPGAVAINIGKVESEAKAALATQEVTDDGGAAVRSKSGRVLGSYLRTEGSKVFVRSGTAGEMAYPAALVEVTQ